MKLILFRLLIYHQLRYSKVEKSHFHFLQLREVVFNFAQKELAPKAQEIDKTNTFTDLRVSFVLLFSFFK